MSDVGGVSGLIPLRVKYVELFGRVVYLIDTSEMVLRFSAVLTLIEVLDVDSELLILEDLFVFNMRQASDSCLSVA